MATTPPSGGEKLPDQTHKKCLDNAHKPQLGSPNKSNPAVTDFILSGDITVEKKFLGASKNPQFISGSNLGIPSSGDCSPPKELSFYQISYHSTAEIVVLDQLNIFDTIPMTRHHPNHEENCQLGNGDDTHMAVAHSVKDKLPSTNTPTENPEPDPGSQSALMISFNRHSPSGQDDDEYRPIQFEDDLSRASEEDDGFSDGIDEDQHCDLLLAAVNGASEQDSVTFSHENPSRMRPSPRLTRSKVASSSSNPQNSRTPTLPK
ncbi:hypothetical protein A4A49_34083 [Nicotiana attenuata]|uniref:Uncharacterized protein n=1 Tax=Nicotiana attenuata TaxID=49451 RepID=A0A1J6KHY2_NICAT|nr:hypothetical protein A4A49_34083 [Nicotiana attenuata]